MKLAHTRVFESLSNTYTKVSKIGEGANGIVYEVRDHENAIFALKLLKPSIVNSDARKRFLNELHYCELTNHPRILKVFDYGFVHVEGIKCPFYVSPRYADTLRTLMKKKLPIASSIEYFYQILEGISAAHKQNVIHRDLKPENILYDEKGDSLVIGDFGIARFADIPAAIVNTKTGQRLGNFQYSAPEQRSKEGTITHLADIYSLGVILNELFTGKLLQGANYEVIGTHYPNVKFLDDIVLKMVQQDPGARYQTVDEIILTLRVKSTEYKSAEQANSLSSRIATSELKQDPPFAYPISISAVDFNPEENLLILELNVSPNNTWIKCFREINPGNDYLSGSRPRDIVISGNRMFMKINPESAELAATFGSKYIKMTTDKYLKHLAQQRELDRAQQEEKLKNAIAMEEARIGALRSIKIENLV